VCLHGSAKSLIAAQHFTRLARERGLPYAGESVGLEPDYQVPMPVIAGLASDGFDVREYLPQTLTPERVATACYVVTFACDVLLGPDTAMRESWDDLPMVSDGFGVARDAIVRRVTALVHSLASASYQHACRRNCAKSRHE
jgi:arsenate reductase (thioredoxin)